MNKAWYDAGVTHNRRKCPICVQKTTKTGHFRGMRVGHLRHDVACVPILCMIAVLMRLYADKLCLRWRNLVCIMFYYEAFYNVKFDLTLVKC